MRKNFGSMVDYILPTAIVGLVLGSALFYLVQNKSILNFTSASNDMKIDSSKKQGIIGAMGDKNYKAGDLKGTTSKPVMQCSFGSCIIDYGDFILQGVPDNFTEYVESAGSSGSTEKLLSLIEQIAEQLEKEGDKTGAKELRDLANMGHTIALVEKKVEEAANNCAGETNQSACFKSYFSEDQDGTPAMNEIKEKLKEILPGAYTYWGMNFYLGYARPDQYVNSKESYLNNQAKIRIGAAFQKKFQEIKNNDKFSEPIRGITEGLYANISNLTANMHGLALSFNSPKGTYTTTVYDPITGKYTSKTFTASNYKDITNPKIGTKNNLNSTLICLSGWNKDTGSSCY